MGLQIYNSCDVRDNRCICTSMARTTAFLSYKVAPCGSHKDLRSSKHRRYDWSPVNAFGSDGYTACNGNKLGSSTRSYCCSDERPLLDQFATGSYVVEVADCCNGIRCGLQLHSVCESRLVWPAVYLFNTDSTKNSNRPFIDMDGVDRVPTGFSETFEPLFFLTFYPILPLLTFAYKIKYTIDVRGH